MAEWKENKMNYWLNRTYCKVDEDAIKRWWKNGRLHREDGPAIEWANGAKEWYWNGEKSQSPEEWLLKLLKEKFPNSFKMGCKIKAYGIEAETQQQVRRNGGC